MDFDSIISFFILIVFFVLPAILKRFQAEKKQAGNLKQSKATEKKPSLFGQIGEKIQEFILELEEQAKQQREAQQRQAQQADNNQHLPSQNSSQDNPWDAFKEQDDSDFSEQVSKIEMPEVNRSKTSIINQAVLHEQMDKAQEDVKRENTKAFLSKKDHFNKKELEKPIQEQVQEKYTFQSGRFQKKQLQNAIIWSEILAKPVGLREKSGY